MLVLHPGFMSQLGSGVLANALRRKLFLPRARHISRVPVVSVSDRRIPGFPAQPQDKDTGARIEYSSRSRRAI